jgi:hypothetical protein
MFGIARRVLAVASFSICTALPAMAQETVRIRGTVERIDGPVYVVKNRDGAEVKLTLTDNPLFVAIVPSKMADIKQGMFVGSAGLMQDNGVQKAIEVHIFPGIQHGYMMPGSPKAFDQKTREFSMKRAVAILEAEERSLDAILLRDETAHTCAADKFLPFHHPTEQQPHDDQNDGDLDQRKTCRVLLHSSSLQ